MVTKQLIHQESGTANLQNIKSRTSPTKTSTMFSAITGILNNHTIDNDDVEVHYSEFPVESNSESVPYPGTTTIK